MTLIHKQRRCKECGCNTLIQCQTSDDESHIKWRNGFYFCVDCKQEVETILFEMSWREETYKESNSKEIMKLKERLEQARENIKRQMDYIESLLTRT